MFRKLQKMQTLPFRDEEAEEVIAAVAGRVIGPVPAQKLAGVAERTVRALRRADSRRFAVNPT